MNTTIPGVQEVPKVPPSDGKGETKPPMRQIIIETDGTNIQLIKAEVGGRIELVGVLQNLITFLNQQK